MNTQTPTAATPCRQQRGISLIERLIVPAVTTVSLGAALPSFQAAQQGRQLDGVAAQLQTDLQLARSLSVAQGQNLRSGFLHDQAGSCYVVHERPARGCRCEQAGLAVCTGPTAPSTVCARWTAVAPGEAPQQRRVDGVRDPRHRHADGHLACRGA